MTIMILRAIIIYFCVVFVIRLMGKRQVGEMQPFEFVITLIIADLACNPMSELSVPLLHGIVPILTLLVVHFLICFLSRKSMFARYLLSGRPAIVIDGNGINYKELRALNMTLDDLMELIRGCSVFNLEEIAYAIIETNGNLCVIKRAELDQPTREDLKIKVDQAGLPMNIIMDGKLMKENVKLAGIDEAFVEKCLKKTKLKTIKQVLIFTLDNNGKVFIQGKNERSFYAFQVEFNGVGKW
ncbi:MAG: DUF421 domain-containing protein [Clostridia bacterium]|nr:DUF421 domain-containing protein [Clostridia bacterium]